MAKYRKTSRDKIIERANARKNQNIGSKCLSFKALPKDMKVEFFKPSKAVHNLDVIGYVLTDKNNPECDENLEPGYLWYARNYWVHRGIGADDDSIICPAKTWKGERCPVCEYAKQRRASGEASKEELDSLKPKQRQLYNVIDRDADPKKVLLFDTSYHLFGRQLDKEILDADDEEISSFFEPENGFTLRARFDKKSFNGRDFYECDRIDFKDRKTQYKESIIDETFPLDDMLNKLSYEQLESLFVMGAELNAPEPDEDEGFNKKLRQRKERDDAEQEEESRKKRRREPEPEPEEDEEDDTPPPPRSKRRKPEPEPEPEDEEEDDGGEDEDEAEPPAPSRKRRTAPPVDDTEDEDDEPPAKPKRRRPADEEEERPRKTQRKREPEPEPDEDEDEPEPEPVKPKRQNKPTGQKCPQGLKWGTDCDTQDCCDDCKMWAGCNAAQRNSK